MNENAKEQKGLFETLEDRAPEIHTQANSKTFEMAEEESKFEFLIQDMFLDHFFP